MGGTNLRKLLLSAALAAGLAACSQPSSDGSEANRRIEASSLRSLGRFLELVRHSLYDYDPVPTPSALLGQADVVVTGTIVDVKPGQSYADEPGGPPNHETSVLEIEVDRILAGDASIVFAGSAYLELAHPAYVGDGTAAAEGGESGKQVPFDHEAFAETVPRAYGLFFLNDRTNEPYSPVILDEGAGRPAGARITAPFIQGFLIEDHDGKPVSVMEPFNLMPPRWHGFQSIAEIVQAATDEQGREGS